MDIPFTYQPENAETYKELGIEGTTFEPSFMEAARMFGDLTGRTVLDFGSGTGRSTRFLKSLGADRVIGVDRNATMVERAVINSGEGIDFYLIQEKIPTQDAFFDVALASQVFMEIGTIEDIQNMMCEIARVLKPNGEFVVIVTNPSAYGHDFMSYSYPEEATRLTSGDIVHCVIKGINPFTITDYFWTDDDYKKALEGSGFAIEETSYPLPKSGIWLDEKDIPPDIVIRARKK